jgi:hypothetical protein
LSFKNPPPPFGMPEEPSRAGSMFGHPLNGGDSTAVTLLAWIPQST